ncbi:solute carrier family 2, facilitated glucose transporter member 14-like isoform X2 [Artemia franciscana]|uniref:solute carrier family 2, facilitated glucose transporter member 14-like isoform X2 n=1 Tax=Artemia franciscana TaxID=6661 RepID=UPI0032D9AEB2
MYTRFSDLFFQLCGGRYTPRLIVTIIANIIGATVPIGWHLSVINAPQHVIKPFCNESMYSHYGIDLSESNLDLVWAFVVSIFLAGGLLGAVFGDRILHKVGRKFSFEICVLSHVIGAILFTVAKFASSVELLVLGRLLVGFGSGLATCVVPIYLAEICPPHISTIVSATLPVGSSTGNLLAQVLAMKHVLGNEEAWAVLLATIGVPCLLCLFLTVIVPESPYYLYTIKKKDSEAIKVLSQLRGLTPEEVVQTSEFHTYKKERADLEREEESEKWDLKKIWQKQTHLRMPVSICLLSHMAQQLSGIAMVFYYSTSVFRAAGLNDNQTYIANIGAAIFNIFMAAFAVWLISRFTLRTLILSSSLTTGISLTGLAVSLIYLPGNESLFLPYSCVTFFVLFVISFGIGLGSVPFSLPSDIIPDSQRPAVSAAGCTLNWSTNFMIAMTFPILQDYIGEGVFFVFFSFTLSIFIFMFVFLRPTYRLKDTTTA